MFPGRKDLLWLQAGVSRIPLYQPIKSEHLSNLRLMEVLLEDIQNRGTLYLVLQVRKVASISEVQRKAKNIDHTVNSFLSGDRTQNKPYTKRSGLTTGALAGLLLGAGWFVGFPMDFLTTFRAVLSSMTACAYLNRTGLRTHDTAMSRFSGVPNMLSGQARREGSRWAGRVSKTRWCGRRAWCSNRSRALAMSVDRRIG